MSFYRGRTMGQGEFFQSTAFPTGSQQAAAPPSSSFYSLEPGHGGKASPGPFGRGLLQNWGRGGCHPEPPWDSGRIPLHVSTHLTPALPQPASPLCCPKLSHITCTCRAPVGGTWGVQEEIWPPGDNAGKMGQCIQEARGLGKWRMSWK